MNEERLRKLAEGGDEAAQAQLVRLLIRRSSMADEVELVQLGLHGNHDAADYIIRQRIAFGYYDYTFDDVFFSMLIARYGAILVWEDPGDRLQGGPGVIFYEPSERWPYFVRGKRDESWEKIILPQLMQSFELDEKEAVRLFITQLAATSITSPDLYVGDWTAAWNPHYYAVTTEEGGIRPFGAWDWNEDREAPLEWFEEYDEPSGSFTFYDPQWENVHHGFRAYEADDGPLASFNYTVGDVPIELEFWDWYDWVPWAELAGWHGVDEQAVEDAGNSPDVGTRARLLGDIGGSYGFGNVGDAEWMNAWKLAYQYVGEELWDE